MAKYDKNYNKIPDRYRPLGAWAYFGYSLLFAIPIVGFILLIVFSFNRDNYNRRNFARSYFVSLLVAAIIILILSLIGISLFDKIVNLIEQGRGGYPTNSFYF